MRKGDHSYTEVTQQLQDLWFKKKKKILWVLQPKMLDFAALYRA